MRDDTIVDGSGNVGNLSKAAGAFAIHTSLVDAYPRESSCAACIWQGNIGTTIVVANGSR